MFNHTVGDRTPWARLQEGNVRWVEDRSSDGGRGAARRVEVSLAQAPFAAVLGCSDSRVPAEILFDQGLGDLFVVRTAGHVADSAGLGSVEYAVEVLGVSLIVVLGHDECGAVAAASRIVDEAQVPHGYIRDVAERIAPNVLRARKEGATTSGAVVGHHSVYTVELLRQRSAIIDNAIRCGAVRAIAAQYCLRTGTVTQVITKSGTFGTERADPAVKAAA